MYIFEMEDIYAFNSVIVVVADTFENAAMLYIRSKYSDTTENLSIDGVKLVKQHNIEVGVITWKDD